MPPKRKTALRQGARPAAWRESSQGPLPGHTPSDSAAESILLGTEVPPSIREEHPEEGSKDTAIRRHADERN